MRDAHIHRVVLEVGGGAGPCGILQDYFTVQFPKWPLTAGCIAQGLHSCHSEHLSSCAVPECSAESPKKR